MWARLHEQCIEEMQNLQYIGVRNYMSILHPPANIEVPWTRLSAVYAFEK